jgi:chromosome segregation ATPase
MAEYAGLEIRIGGNTTKLTNALKAPTKAAAELQRQIRQATRAMQFDPTDLKNVDTRIRLTGDRMESLQSKVKLVKTAMDQLGDSVVKLGGRDRSVREVAEDTDNLALRAKQADERFNGMTNTLAKIYEAWNKVARSKGADTLVDQLGFTQAEADHLMNSTTTLRDFTAELRREQELRSSLGYNGGKPLISDADIANLQKFKELDFHDMFKRGLDIDDVVADAEKLGVVIEDSAIANVRELQRAFKETQGDKDAFDKALRFEQMGTDIQRLNSEAESLSQTMRQLDDSLNPTRMTTGFQDLEARVRSIDAALKNVDTDLERTGAAMKADPRNIGLAARYYQDLQQKASLSEEKVRLLNEQMGMLNADGAEEAARGHQDLARWVEESAEAARVAGKELSDQRAEVANLDDQVRTLKQTIATMKGDSTMAGYSDAVLEWQKRTQKLNDEMGVLETRQKALANQKGAVDKAQADFDEATARAKEYERQLESLEVEYKELEAAMEAAFENGQYDASMDQYMSALKSTIEEIKTSYKGATRDATEFERKLRGQQKLFSDMSTDVDTVEAGVKDLRKEVAALEQTRDVKLFQNPTGEIERTEAELVDLRGEADRAKAKMNELEAAYDSAKSENELAKTAQAAREVSQEADEARASLVKITDELDTKKSSIINNSTLKSLGMTLSATVTPALTAIGYKMVDASADVDAAYRDMRKTVEGTEEQFEHLRAAAIEFSRTHVTSADQILQIEAIGGELGIATENLETFAEVISNIDVATNLDTESAADALGHLANILHLTEKDYVGFSDALVRLGNNGASTETEIANIAERIGSMGAIVGMSGSDVLAWASSLASTGQNAEAAATALSKTWSYFETSVAAAGGTIDTSFGSIKAAVEEGGDKLTIFANLAGMTADEFTEAWEEAPEDMAATLHDQMEAAKGDLQMIADVAHMSAADFAKAWESDPTEAAKAFIQGLNDIEASGGSADKVLQSLGITAVRQKQGIEGLMQTIGGLDDNLKMSEDAWNGVSDRWGKAGDAANEAAKKAEGFSGQIQILKNMWQNFLSELGEGAVPIIKSLSGQLESMSRWFSQLDSNTKTLIVTLGGIAAAAGPMLAFTATLRNVIGETNTWVKDAFSGINIVKMACKNGFGDISESAMKAMTTMDKVKLVGMDLGTSLAKGLALGAVVAGVVLLANELYKLYEHYQDHIAATKGLSDALAGIGDVSTVTADGIDGVGTSLSNLASDSREYESRLADLAQTIGDSNRQYGEFAGKLDYYAGVVETLGGKANRSQDETYKLSAALEAVNDACGTTYGLDNYGNIIDTETGKVMDNTDAIRANIDARKQQAMVDYYSDDYAKATEEWAAAQDELNDAQTKYNDLTSEEGKKAYFDHAKQVYGALYDEAQIQNAYNKEVNDAQTAIRNYTAESSRAEEVMGVLEGKISSAEEAQRKANETIKEAAAAQEEYDRRTQTVTDDVTGNMKKLSDAFTGEDSGFNLLADVLDAVHVSAEELAGVDMSALADAGDSMTGLVSTLEDGGVAMTTWNAALEQTPGAADNMASVTSAAFKSMYDSANDDINATMTLIAGLDTVNVGDKTFYVGDNGSITDAEGKVYNIKNDLASIPREVITTVYADNKEALQSTLEAKDKLEDVNKQNPTPKLSVDDQASSKVKSLQDDLNKVGSARPTASAFLQDYASSKLGGILTSLRNLDGRSATVYVNQVTKKGQATGGLNGVPVIPKHATGYIATGPTLTNQGWIGEDGVEAVANWATGGAVVPLTNKRYMLPIADAIAEGMSRRVAQVHSVPTAQITVNGVSSPDETARAIERRMRMLALAERG